MASFDTGWAYTTAMYLNFPHNIRVTGTATRTSSTNVRVTGTFYLSRAGSSYNYDYCKARLSNTSSWVQVKGYTTSAYSEVSAGFSYDMAVGAGDTTIKIQGVFAFFGSSGSSQVGNAGRTSETYPSIATEPAKPNISIKEIMTTGVKFDVYVSSWGSGSTSDRYYEAALMNHGGDYGSPYCYTHGTHGINAGVTETLEVSTAHHHANSSITTISPNTQYNYGAWCTNGSLTKSVMPGTVVTLAPAATVSTSTIGETTIKINYSTSADGGKYTKNIQYSINNGSTWTTGATVSSSSASSGSYTISGLEPGTTYTIKTRVNTTAGSTTGSTLTATTLEAYKLYGSVSNKTKKVKKLYCSVSGKTKKIKKLYGSVGGKTKRIF